MLNTGIIKLLSGLVVALVLFSPSRSARGGDDEVDKIPTRYGMAAVLGDTFDPDENINFVQLAGFVMWDYDKVWRHWAPEALRFKVEGTAGLTTSPKTRAMVSVGMMAPYYLEFISSQRLNPYIEGGLGVIYTDFHVEGQGSRFNFYPQAGIGAEIKVDSGPPFFGKEAGGVVVTDAAAVTALGNNLESLWQGLMAGQTAIRPITRFPVDQDHHKAKIAAHINDLKSSGDRSMLQDLLDRLFLGMGPVPADAELMTATIKSGADNLESFCRGKPASFQDVLLSSMADIVSARFGLAGNGICVSASCASSTIAVAHGAALIESGRAEAVLVCCGDLITEYHFSGFSALKALSPFACRPFDRDRQGLSLGEGAAALLLMSAARVRRENRDQLGTILGWGISNDATHITAPAKSGRGLVQAVNQALGSAQKKPEDIAVISAHGTGTVYNDLMELNAFRQVFGERKLPVYSIKGAVGHTLGAAGGLEIILGLKTLSARRVPPTVGFSNPEKGAEGQVSSGPQDVSGDYLLTTNSGFGGVNAALVLGR